MRNATRDLRRTYAIVAALDAALEAVEALRDRPDGVRRQEIAAVLHSHLGHAFDAAAGEVASLETALNARESEVRELRARITGLQNQLRSALDRLRG